MDGPHPPESARRLPPPPSSSPPSASSCNHPQRRQPMLLLLLMVVVVALAFTPGAHAFVAPCSPSLSPSLRRPSTGGDQRPRAARRGAAALWASSSSSSSAAVAGEGRTRSLLTGEVPFQLYNTASRKKEPFKTGKPGRVAFYSCGPTVYDFAHIGNFRAFLTYDVLKRWLIYSGYEVDHVCNLTDVDDKIIKRMARDNVSLQDLTDKYATVFFEDLKALNILPASRYPRATEHIDDIVQMIQELMQRGYAYESKGSVYFRVSKFPQYGKLAWLDFAGMVDGAGEGGGINDADEYVAEKGDAKDFALWKAYKPEDGPVFWETPLGKGRPGWHIECSAMARRFLGATLDLHAGGVDLVFPHHENEIAQSEAATGQPFCRCWVHNGFVNVDNEKMSKSKGNFLTLRAALATDLDLRAFRYLVVSSQYRTPLNFNAEALQGARKTVLRLDKLRAALRERVGGQFDEKAAAAAAGEEVADLGTEEVVAKALAGFEAGMADDLNTPRAAAALFTLVKGAEKALKANGGGEVAPVAARRLLGALARMDAVVGVFYDPPAMAGVKKAAVSAGEPEAVPLEALSPEARALVAQRGEAKEAKDWALADRLREELRAAHGLVLKDVKGGGVQVLRDAEAAAAAS